MTQGNIQKHLTTFAIPLIIGNIFQLTYNAADSIIVGRFVGTEAQAAIGTANPLMNIMIFLIVGMCNGTAVLMSEYYGSKNNDNFKKELSTAITAGVLFAAMLSIGFASLSYPLLYIIQVPSSILLISAQYLMIISGGLMFNFLYNFYAASLRSMGDAKTPLIFLIFSAFVNIALDCIFVIIFKWGVLGAGTATFISEMLSAIMCVIYVYRHVPELQLNLNEFHIHKDFLKKTIHYSWSTGMQKISLNVGKVLIQAFVNPLGIDAIATFNAVSRVDDFVFQPQQSIGTALTTFVAQNRGGKQTVRVHNSLKIGMIMQTIYWVFIGTVVYITAPYIMHLFNASDSVISLGVTYLRAMSFFYLLPAMTNGLQGFVRGWGRMNVCLISTTVQMIARVGIAMILIPLFGIAGVSYSCAFGWIIMLAYEVPYYVKHLRNETV